MLASPLLAVNKPPEAVVRPFPSVRSDASILEGLRDGQPWASAALFDRYAPQVERVLRRILGHDLHVDLADVLHDAFVQILASAGRVRDPEALGGWIQSVAAHTAYKTIRARKARRWLRFWEPEELPEVQVEDANPETIEAYRRTYALLARLPTDERIAFALRHIEGMELTRVAEACEVSLATIKRRLAKAERRFSEGARRDDVLRVWLEEGGRWTT